MSYVLFPKSVIDQTLQAPTEPGVRLLEPLKTLALAGKVPFNILEESHMSGEPEVHLKHADLWGCLEGEATFLCGGELVGQTARINADGSPNENELKGDSITGAQETVVGVGDWLWIPAGMPHQHRADTSVRMIIIKIPTV